MLTTPCILQMSRASTLFICSSWYMICNYQFFKINQYYHELHCTLSNNQLQDWTDCEIVLDWNKKEWEKPGFHYPSWWPELTGDRFPLPVNTGRVDGRAFPLAELTGHQHGPSTRLVEMCTRKHATRVVKTGLNWVEFNISFITKYVISQTRQ